MATRLHYVISRTKKLARFAILSAIGVLAFILFLRIGLTLKEYYFPTPPPIPTVSFGKLPSVTFPKNAVEAKMSFTIDTLSGTLPSFPSQMTVYEVAKNPQGLLNLQRAKEKAANIGFTSPPIAMSENVYEWRQDGPITKKISKDIVYPFFNLSSNFLLHPEVFTTNTLLNQDGAKTVAQQFFQSLDGFPKDIDQAKTTITFFTITNGTLIPVAKSSSAHISRVDFFQKDINEIPIVYPRPKKSIIYAVIGNETLKETIVEAGFAYHPLTDKTATYPIKTAQEAFDELAQGSAYIASYEGSATTIPIQNVRLGYYLTQDFQAYVTPVIIFEAENAFSAYVNAIKDEWFMEKDQEK